MKKRKRLFDVNGKLLILVLLLLAGADAGAAPTVNNDSSCVSLSVSASLDVHVHAVSEISEITQYSNSQLGDIAVEFIRPPIIFLDSQANVQPEIEALPPVPGAILMVGAGFACVSLVRDRKAWLKMVSGLLCMGRVGIDAVPELVSYIHQRQIKQMCSREMACLYKFVSSLRSRCDVEGTRYIGLLHYLEGIPDCENTIIQRGRGTALSHSAYKTLLNGGAFCTSSFLITVISAIIQNLISFNHSSFYLENCLTVRASFGMGADFA